jgi:hypothetical protein
VALIAKGITEGKDTDVCLLNYRKDGSTFYNRFFVAPLRGADNKIVNFVGVQVCWADSGTAAQASLTISSLLDYAV